MLGSGVAMATEKGRRSGQSSAHVHVRIQQPVEGYAVELLILGRKPGGTLVPKQDLRWTTVWYRSTGYRPCASRLCPTMGTSPDQGYSVSRVLQCLPAVKSKAPPALSVFCSSECLRRQWPYVQDQIERADKTSADRKEDHDADVAQPDEAGFFCIPPSAKLPGQEKGWTPLSRSK